MMTSNRAVEEWGMLLSNVPAASAILDRLLHHAEVTQASQIPNGAGLCRRPDAPNARYNPSATPFDTAICTIPSRPIFPASSDDNHHDHATRAI